MDDKEERNIQSKGKNNMNKVIIVTGGSRGIGASIVRLLAKDDNKVILNYNKSEEEAKKLQQELEEQNFKLEIFKADVSKREDVKKLVEYTIEKYGKIDILINNAGISEYKLFTDETDEDWDKLINTNLYSAFAMSQEVIPNMVHNKKGCIINISSIWGIVGGSLEVLYSISKAGLDGMTKALAKELGPSNIRVNSIAPGMINTKMNSKFTEKEIEEIKEEWYHVKNEEIHNINREYRHTDRVTDVISFALEDNPDVVYDSFRLLGDIYIAIDVAYDQAVEYNHSREREVCFLATHGLLHLLGYDHMTIEEEKVMFGKQEELLNEFEIKR